MLWLAGYYCTTTSMVHIIVRHHDALRMRYESTRGFPTHSSSPYKSQDQDPHTISYPNYHHIYCDSEAGTKTEYLYHRALANVILGRHLLYKQ
eukprot:scaffold2430_cov159-Amphora_coffeaeformis.AAC.2